MFVLSTLAPNFLIQVFLIALLKSISARHEDVAAKTPNVRHANGKRRF